MDNHKKLIMVALVLTGVATLASMVAYMTSVSSRSKAATREDIQKFVSSIYPSVQPTSDKIVPKLTVDKAVVKSAGTVDLKTQGKTVDKTSLHVEFTNTTGKEMKGAKMFLSVSGKSKYALGKVSGATPVKSSSQLKKGYIEFTLPNLQPGQTAAVDVPFIVRTPGSSMKVTALLKAPGSKITATKPVTIQSN
jgi:hypothetical protein